LTQCQRVTDGRTDRRTDGFTMANTALCIASYMLTRCKNGLLFGQHVRCWVGSGRVGSGLLASVVGWVLLSESMSISLKKDVTLCHKYRLHTSAVVVDVPFPSSTTRWLASSSRGSASCLPASTTTDRSSRTTCDRHQTASRYTNRPTYAVHKYYT